MAKESLFEIGILGSGVICSLNVQNIALEHGEEAMHEFYATHYERYSAALEILREWIDECVLIHYDVEDDKIDDADAKREMAMREIPLDLLYQELFHGNQRSLTAVVQGHYAPLALGLTTPNT